MARMRAARRDNTVIPKVRRTRWAALGLVAASMLGGGLLAACGGGSDGNGRVVVVGAAAQRGQEVVWSNGCIGCHSEDGSYSSGPTWQGLAGSEVTLKGGREVLADDAYLRGAITEPTAELVDGYWPVMPAVPLTAAQLDDVIAYLKALPAASSDAEP